MIAAISFWSHVVASGLFLVLAVVLLLRKNALGRRALAVGCLLTGLWTLCAALWGGESGAAGYAESLRNIGWLAFMFLLSQRGEGGRNTWPLTAIYGALLLVLVAQSATGLIVASGPQAARMQEGVLLGTFVLRMIFAIGALLLVHNIYSAAAPEARASVALPLAALAAMWAYDLNLFTLSYLAHGWLGELAAGRGAVALLLAPAFALAGRKAGSERLRLSRTAAFRSLSLVATAAYLLAMFGLSALFDAVGGMPEGAAGTVVACVAGAIALVVLSSKRSRAWTRVMLAKHLFAHRYDYRSEWLRFTDTLGRPGDAAAPLDVRVIKGIADITESPAGLLLLPEGGSLVAKAGWNRAIDGNGTALPAAAVAGTCHIIEVDTVRNGTEPGFALPRWILDDKTIWAIVPLVHFDRLAGAVLLERPPLDRTLDWEDFDLLRIAGRQVASYLAEAQGQETLSEVQRFDEFNRRFAFIMHDIKNLVSQLTLVTRNAERHAGNPEFQADMIATLQASTTRMNALLTRLAEHHQPAHDDISATALGPIAKKVAAAKSNHPIVVSGDASAIGRVDAARMEAALSHLVQNAIEASAPHDPVLVDIGAAGPESCITITDRGCGMTQDFIRSALFRPFASTKDVGFGVGAYEAKSIVTAMGGRIEVQSTPGKGSCFAIYLPATQPALETRAA